MPTSDDQETLERAREDLREGKSPSTQAGEFVREEIDHVREGKHGAASVKQAIAIGLSKARRAGVNLPPPTKGPASIRQQARRDLRKGKSPQRKVSSKRSRATLRALQQESTRRHRLKRFPNRHAQAPVFADRRPGGMQLRKRCARKQRPAGAQPHARPPAHATGPLPSAITSMPPIHKKSKARETLLDVFLLLNSLVMLFSHWAMPRK